MFFFLLRYLIIKSIYNNPIHSTCLTPDRVTRVILFASAHFIAPDSTSLPDTHIQVIFSYYVTTHLIAQ